MDEGTLREMREDDIRQIMDIENESFSTPWTEAAFLAEIHKPYSLSRVLMIGDRLVGYLCMNLILDEGHILNLAVYPDFRRRGLATRLINEALTELKKKGCRFIYLEVRGSNTVAKQFYLQFGFRDAGLRKKYYTSPVEDAVLMMRQL
ncbi:MAG: ribosomal protein S18-alanine N-acetyltransferase [Thermodesulfovibrionales bacterium]|nr:ribosomal protein S18-alanine N-acetyltransferase [Thermodesulfovibrionales bacterium]